jgi:hypothetical protein
MSRHLSRTALETDATIVSAPHARPNRVDRAFDLHPALYGATLAGFGGFLVLMWAAFGEAQLAITFAICIVFIGMYFAIPTVFARVDGRAGPFASWGDFMREGFDCLTGHLTAKETIAQVLIMPAMLLFWGLCVAVIKALT